LNGALPYTNATVCEIAATLNGLTKLKILGDFTKAGEGVAIDDIAITASTKQPVFPIQCQQGCVCKHFPSSRRITCCGNDLQVSSQDTQGRRLQENEEDLLDPASTLRRKLSEPDKMGDDDEALYVGDEALNIEPDLEPDLGKKIFQPGSDL